MDSLDMILRRDGLQFTIESEQQLNSFFDVLYHQKSTEMNDRCNREKTIIDELNNRCVVSRELELLDPNPNIWQLMQDFDNRYFFGQLGAHNIELRWHSELSSWCGRFVGRPKTKCGYIYLSKPLLLLRTRQDLVETLLHEMIHAYIFVMVIDRCPTDQMACLYWWAYLKQPHGPLFVRIMNAVNAMSGARVTIYHKFHDELDYYKTHVWRCNGVCRNWSPHFGYVRRPGNRNPGFNDCWSASHSQACGGEFVLIEKYIDK